MPMRRTNCPNQVKVAHATARNVVSRHALSSMGAAECCLQTLINSDNNSEPTFGAEDSLMALQYCLTFLERVNVDAHSPET